MTAKRGRGRPKKAAEPYNSEEAELFRLTVNELVEESPVKSGVCKRMLAESMASVYIEIRRIKNKVLYGNISTEETRALSAMSNQMLKQAAALRVDFAPDADEQGIEALLGGLDDDEDD